MESAPSAAETVQAAAAYAAAAVDDGWVEHTPGWSDGGDGSPKRPAQAAFFLHAASSVRAFLIFLLISCGLFQQGGCMAAVLAVHVYAELVTGSGLLCWMSSSPSFSSPQADRTHKRLYSFPPLRFLFLFAPAVSSSSKGPLRFGTKRRRVRGGSPWLVLTRRPPRFAPARWRARSSSTRRSATVTCDSVEIAEASFRRQLSSQPNLDVKLRIIILRQNPYLQA